MEICREVANKWQKLKAFGCCTPPFKGSSIWKSILEGSKICEPQYIGLARLLKTY